MKYISKGRIEFQTTDLGAAAFDGDIETVRAALCRGIDWTLEKQYPLEGAICGEHLELARELIKAGAPITDNTYKLIYEYGDHELFKSLPPRKDLLETLADERQWLQFNHAVIQENIDDAERLIKPSRINDETRLLAGQIAMRPIHYVSRNNNFELLKLVVEAGADINALSAEGKSPLRMVSECGSSTDADRARCFRYLRERGAELQPPVEGWFTRWRLRRGAYLRRTD